MCYGRTGLFLIVQRSGQWVLAVKAFPCGICRMKQLVGLMGIRGAQELVIQLDDLRVIVGLTYRLPLILRVESLRTFLLVGVDDIIIFIGEEAGTYIGLAAAIDASAGTTHDLDKLIFGLPFPDLLQKDFRGFHAGRDRYIYGGSVDVEGSFTDTRIMTAYLFEGDLIMLLAGEFVIDGTESSLHNTAGDTEDDTCA